MPNELIGYTHAEMVRMMMDAGIHCSVDKFRTVALDLQRAAVRQSADIADRFACGGSCGIGMACGKTIREQL